MYTLYTIPGSCSSGITVLLEKLQLEYSPVKRDSLVKSHRSCLDGLWKKFDILGVVSETVIRQYM